jgi:hypothetical protein
MRSDKPTVTEKGGDEAFLSRWSRLKQAESQAIEPVDQNEPVEDKTLPKLTDADMPPLESLTEESDYSGFLSPEVTEQLRQQALQKLFRSACFNICDGLDDYAEDFTSFEKLGDVITADLKFRMQQEAEKLAESVEKGGAENSRVADESVSDRDNTQANNEQPISQDDEDESEASV